MCACVWAGVAKAGREGEGGGMGRREGKVAWWQVWEGKGKGARGRQGKRGGGKGWGCGGGRWWGR